MGYHMRKWCEYFSTQGHEVHVLSFWPGENQFAQCHLLPHLVNPDGKQWTKVRYLSQGRAIRNIVSKLKPDIIHVHYASSYGVTCAFAGIEDYFLSIWGSDIYDFPTTSFLHKYLISRALRQPKYLLSTSRAMASEAHKYTSRKFEITPFGVDIDLFTPEKRTRRNDGVFIVGTVKTLSPKYGIDNILKACRLVLDRRPNLPIQIQIAGSGPQESELRTLAHDLDLDGRVKWLGFISQMEAAIAWANMDVAIIPSVLESESFGVAAVEAQACAIPVIVSDIPGLMESTFPQVSSMVFARGNVDQLSCAIEFLYDNPAKRKQMGIQGRIYVKQNFEYNHCFQHISDLYESSLTLK